MILELAACRLTARSLGSSLYTWTSIVGVVLTGLSLGNYLGGRLADRCHARRVLAVLFGLSSAVCVGIVVVNNAASDWMWLWRLSWPAHVLVHVLLVFLLPSALLAAVGPIMAKMALDQGLSTGRTIGSIYAWGAIGGIVGTFLAGFFLLVAFGNAALLWFLGAALLTVALLYWISCWAMYLWAMVFVALMTMGVSGDEWAQEAGRAAFLRDRPDPNAVYEAETPYGHVTVRQIAERPERRVLVQDSSRCAEMTLNDATCLRDFHLRVYAGLTRGLLADKKDPSLLVLGAGGYVFPRYLKTVWPQSRLAVVESDPGVTQAAEEALGLEQGPPIGTVHLDARSFVHGFAKGGCPDVPRCDFIYEDALDGGAIPASLATKEFHDEVAGLLADDGVYLAHLTDLRQGGQLLGPVVNTVRETFPYVYVIADRPCPPSECGSFVIVAARRELDPQTILAEQDEHLKFFLLDPEQLGDLRERSGGVIFTDDYAPVQNLYAPVVRHNATGILARKCFEKAQALQNDDQPEPSIQWYHRALKADPALAAAAYEQIGLIHIARNCPEEAMESFRQAIVVHAETGGRPSVVGAAHMNLGILLRRAGQLNQGEEQLAKAVEWFRVEVAEHPESVAIWESLGDTTAALGNFKGASDAFAEVVKLEPGNPSHYHNLARMLEMQHRYDEAANAVRRQIKLLQDQGRKNLVAQLWQYVELLEYKKVKQANR